MNPDYRCDICDEPITESDLCGCQAHEGQDVCRECCDEVGGVSRG